jgi:hypothetical protein
MQIGNSAEIDNDVLIDVLRPLWPPMPIDVRAARVHGPGIIADLTADQHVIARLTTTDSDVRLAVRKVKKAFGDNEINLQKRILRLKGIDQRLHERAHESLWAGDTDGAGQALIACLQATFQRGYSLFNAYSAGQQFLSERGQSVAGRVPLDQLATDALLQHGKPSLHRGLVHAQRFRRCDRASSPRNREEKPQIVPIEHDTLCVSAETSGNLAAAQQRNQALQMKQWLRWRGITIAPQAQQSNSPAGDVGS